MKHVLVAAVAVVVIGASPASAWNDSTYTGSCQLNTGATVGLGQDTYATPLSAFFQTSSMSAPVVWASVSCYVRVNGVVVAVLEGNTMSGPITQSGGTTVTYVRTATDVLDVCWDVDYTDASDTTPTATTC